MINIGSLLRTAIEFVGDCGPNPFTELSSERYNIFSVVYE